MLPDSTVYGLFCFIIFQQIPASVQEAAKVPLGINYLIQEYLRNSMLAKLETKPLIMPPTAKKFERHSAFGLSVPLFVHLFVTLFDACHIV